MGAEAPTATMKLRADTIRPSKVRYEKVAWPGLVPGIDRVINTQISRSSG